MESCEERVRKLNEFVLDEDEFPVTKSQKRAAREKRQKDRSDWLVKMSKGGAHVPEEELRRRARIFRID